MLPLHWLDHSLIVLLITAPAQQPALSQLSFMAGCWNGVGGSGMMIEEHYTTPSENVILGTTRFITGGKTVGFELTTIVGDSNGVHLTPYPNGRQQDVSFALAKLENQSAVFENPDHDFPQIITYRRVNDDTLSVRAETPGGRVLSYEMMAVRCRESGTKQ